MKMRHVPIIRPLDGQSVDLLRASRLGQGKLGKEWLLTKDSCHWMRVDINAGNETAMTCVHPDFPNINVIDIMEARRPREQRLLDPEEAEVLGLPRLNRRFLLSKAASGMLLVSARLGSTPLGEAETQVKLMQNVESDIKVAMYNFGSEITNRELTGTHLQRIASLRFSLPMEAREGFSDRELPQEEADKAFRHIVSRAFERGSSEPTPQ